MVILDAPVHLWQADTPAHPWLPERRGLAAGKPPSFVADDLLREMASAGVDGALVVPASFTGWRNDVVVEATRRPLIMRRVDGFEDPCRRCRRRCGRALLRLPCPGR